MGLDTRGEATLVDGDDLNWGYSGGLSLGAETPPGDVCPGRCSTQGGGGKGASVTAAI